MWRVGAGSAGVRQGGWRTAEGPIPVHRATNCMTPLPASHSQTCDFLSFWLALRARIVYSKNCFLHVGCVSCVRTDYRTAHAGHASG